MDEFDRTLGPDKVHRAFNIARNASAAEKYFNFMIEAILSLLLGINRTQRRIYRSKGIFGVVNAYIGMVESQGQGTLHLHILIWLKGSPTAEEIQTLLKNIDFREKVKRFIHQNFRAYHDLLSSEQAITGFSSDPEVGYSRFPNPDGENFSAKLNELEAKVARTKQIHTCGKGCLKPNKQGVMTCKRRAPWALSSDDTVDESGEWNPKRTYGYFNNYIPAVTVTAKCNNDGKLLLVAADSEKLDHYIAGYMTKKQGKTYNCSAMLARGVAFNLQRSSYLEDLRTKQRLLLFRCVHMINGEQELSMEMIWRYLHLRSEMVSSHSYSTLYWSDFHFALLREFPELQVSPAMR